MSPVITSSVKNRIGDSQLTIEFLDRYKPLEIERLALSGLAMANDVGPVTVRTVQDRENHEATRSRWGQSIAEILVESSTSTPVRHLPSILAQWSWSTQGAGPFHYDQHDQQGSL